MDEGLIMALVAFALGGVLKGAIGAGTPVIVIPIMSLYYGVPFAVAVFVIPALLSNGWQLWRFRAALLPIRFILPLVLGAGGGALVGTMVLASVSERLLMLTVAVMALVYVAFRLYSPNWALPYPAAQRLALPVGLAAGFLQGAAGISAPVSLTFISALRLDRLAFIATVSAFFLAMATVQIPVLWSVGLLPADRILLSLVACVPLFAGMPVGHWLARFISRSAFDRIVMALLAVIALRLMWKAF